jgi:hypothetical protein
MRCQGQVTRRSGMKYNGEDMFSCSTRLSGGLLIENLSLQVVYIALQAITIGRVCMQHA